MDSQMVKIQALVPFIENHYPDHRIVDSSRKALEQLQSLNNMVSFDLDDTSEPISITVSPDPKTIENSGSDGKLLIVLSSSAGSLSLCRHL
jgi:hypothetical protein